MMSADQTKMPEMACAAVVVRKSCWPSWESLWAVISMAKAGEGVAEASVVTVLGPGEPGGVGEGTAWVALLICRRERHGEWRRMEVSWGGGRSLQVSRPTQRGQTTCEFFSSPGLF